MNKNELNDKIYMKSHLYSMTKRMIYKHLGRKMIFIEKKYTKDT